MSHEHAPPAHPRTLRLRPAVIGLLVVAAVTAAIGLALRAHDYHQLVKQVDAEAIPTVALAAPLGSMGAHTMTLPGHIDAWISAPIHAQVSGYVKSWNKDIGSHVEAGETLAVIDTPELDQQYEQAKAVLVRAQANAQLAQVTSQRWQHLLSSNSVSKQEADEKASEAAVAGANVLSAKADLDRLAALEAFRNVTAPFAGTVTARNTDIGDLVTADSQSALPLFTVADTDKMRLYVAVPQRYASSIRPGMTVSLTVPDHPGKSYQGTLIGSSDAVSQASGSLLAQFEVANDNGKLLPGDYADVQLPLATSQAVTSVPSTVLIFRAQGPQIAVLGPGNKVVMRDVHIAMDLGGALEIDRGLQPGDRIIDNPPDSLAAGDTVRVASGKESSHGDE
ncbi:efflux RND transporter periplasmic adaptor subunit [Rhodanobacter sp. 7MK24]|uniref:efflux RND transporter periplasmic adaptor subunit n=1 Tax=Rhodanobacter sp. 7MK24 TaxID=2775922 RepID=UPI00177E7A8D|nr:efflux RND transporter periplasmic adaptor subunit [Rhodanobacter sp. 7MK24]MBD8882231.1 efflux RND transporter periplasmic adaptor subunit [Rhodanobacter sp. 7MK24]